MNGGIFVNGDFIPVEHRKLPRQGDSVKGELRASVGIVSHELRTPLTSIKSLAENLLEGLTGPLNEKQHYYVSRIQLNADQLRRMLNELLDLSKIEAGKWSCALLFCHSKSYLLISWKHFSPSPSGNRS
jgi:signal transduction histidine kinase